MKLLQSQESIQLAPHPFASGGEGNLYNIETPGKLRNLYIAKIYHPQKRNLERQNKLKYLVQNPPFNSSQAESVVWMKDLIVDGAGAIIGFIMPFAKGIKLENLTSSKLPRNLDREWMRFDFKHEDAQELRLRLCLNLAIALQQVHQSEQYVLVDLKPDNVIVQSNGLLSLVDIDSIEVVKDGHSLFDAPVATPEYTPPEHYIKETILGYDPSSRQTWDQFSMAVIFYKLLCGVHPYAAASVGIHEHCLSLEQKIEAGLFVHDPKKKAYLGTIPPPHERFNKLSPVLQALFRQAFEEGHRNPELRPEAEDWCNAFLEAINDPKLNQRFAYLDNKVYLYRTANLNFVPASEFLKEEFDSLLYEDKIALDVIEPIELDSLKKPPKFDTYDALKESFAGQSLEVILKNLGAFFNDKQQRILNFPIYNWVMASALSLIVLSIILEISFFPLVLVSFLFLIIPFLNHQQKNSKTVNLKKEETRLLNNIYKLNATLNQRALLPKLNHKLKQIMPMLRANEQREYNRKMAPIDEKIESLKVEFKEELDKLETSYFNKTQALPFMHGQKGHSLQALFDSLKKSPLLENDSYVKELKEISKAYKQAQIDLQRSIQARYDDLIAMGRRQLELSRENLKSAKVSIEEEFAKEHKIPLDKMKLKVADLFDKKERLEKIKEEIEQQTIKPIK